LRIYVLDLKFLFTIYISVKSVFSANTYEFVAEVEQKRFGVLTWTA